MRRRLVVSTIAIVLVVLGTLAIPVGLIVYEAAEHELAVRLEEQATTVADLVSTDLDAGRSPDINRATALLGPRDGLQITDAEGEVVTSVMPDDISAPRTAVRLTANGYEVRLVTDANPLDERFRSQLNILLALAFGGLVAAAALAAIQARQLARPLERLAARAGRLGEGDFSVKAASRTRIPEIDHIASALDTSSKRVETMLSTERHFTADATHQLRTGITGIAMRLEILSMNSDPDVAAEASAGLAQTDQLNETIDELLALARDRSSTERTVFDLYKLASDHVEEWQPRFAMTKRHVSAIISNAAPPVLGTKGLAGQVLDILIDNALKHGKGAVTLMIDGPSVVVIDQGAGIPTRKLKSAFDGPSDHAAQHGRGLALARRLAQVDGGSLDIVGNRPLRIRFRLMRGDTPGAVNPSPRG